MRNLFFWEWRLLARYQILSLMGMITLLYALLVGLLPEAVVRWLLPLLLFTDTTVVGMFFLGGLLYFERTEGTLGLRQTLPVGIHLSWLSKVMAFTSLSTISGLLVALSSGVVQHWGLLLFTLILASALFTLIGLVLALRYETVPSYFLRSMGFSLLLFLPVITDWFKVPQPWLFWHPTAPLLAGLKNALVVRPDLGESAPLILPLACFFFLAKSMLVKGKGAPRLWVR